MLAASYQNGGFHRALVIRAVVSSVLRLFFVDYGTVDNQKVKHCRFLHKQFVSLPGFSGHLGVEASGGREEVGQGEQGQGQVGGADGHLGGGLVAQIKAGLTRNDVTVKGEDELKEEGGLALSLIDVLEGDNGLDVGTQLVMEGMA